MKLIAVLAFVLLALTGCAWIEPPALDADVGLVGNPGIIYQPKINNMPFGYNANVQPGETLTLDFNPGLDQYGNKTGLSSSRYEIDTVTAKCALKTEFDTIFAMADPNAPIWFPCWTAPTETISGLPIPYVPLEGYPWDSCRTVGLVGLPSQQATITATARANWIEVEFVLPERDGSYLLDLPGQSSTSSNTITIRIDRSGDYTVTHSGGDVYEFIVPEDWFWIDGEWTIDVGPTGTC